MGFPGPSPKPDDERERRNAPTFSTTSIRADGRLHGPRLPKDHAWCEQTQKWWEVWRRSPQAMVMTDTDWEYMLETAILHNMLWSPPKSTETTPRRNGAVSATQLAAEIRQRVAKFGATFEDRLKLRMSIQTPHDQVSDEERISQQAAEDFNYLERVLKATAKE